MLIHRSLADILGVPCSSVGLAGGLRLDVYVQFCAKQRYIVMWTFHCPVADLCPQKLLVLALDLPGGSDMPLLCYIVGSTYLICVYLIMTCWTTWFMGGGLPARSSAVDLESFKCRFVSYSHNPDAVINKFLIHRSPIIVTYRICNEISSHLLAFLFPPGDKSRSRCSSNLRWRQKWLHVKMITHLSASE